MSILTVERTVITIGITEIDAYTANEISSTTGAPINYLSGAGLAESIGLANKTTIPRWLSKDLKAMLGEGFTTIQGKYKNSTKAYSKISLWDTTSAAKYYFYHALQGNQRASAICLALSATTLDIIINDKFNRQYQTGQAEAWVKARTRSKDAFWSLSDAVKEYIDNHPERSDNYRAFIYSNCQDCLNRGLFGKSASKIRDELSVKDLLRDHYGKAVLKRLDIIQAASAAIIVNQDVEPLEAVKQVLTMFNFEVISYTE